MLPEPIKDPATTALWEQGLDDIAQGRGDLTAFINGQSRWIKEILRQIKQHSTSETTQTQGLSVDRGHEQPLCPQCAKPLRRRKGKNGWFWGCTGYPDCNNTLPDDHGKPGQLKKRSTSKTNDRSVDTTYSCQCGDGYLQRRHYQGKYFWGCSTYPACKHTQPDNDEKPGTKKKSPKISGRVSAGGACPSCNTGQLVKRTFSKGKNRGRDYLGCTNFPSCRHFAWIDVAERPSR
jgi:DNA topoisomerase-3